MTDDEDTTAEDKALKESHNLLDDAVRGHVAAVGVEGLVTGWVLVAAVAEYTETDELDGMWSSTSDGLSKWVHVGLLDMALHNAKRDGFI